MQDEMVKQQLRKVARTMAAWPIVGRFVRIGVAVIRMPDFRTTYLNLNHRQHIFETEQLPTLLKALSDLNHRQLSSDNDKENLVKSAPIALRRNTRDLNDIRTRLESVADSVHQRINEAGEQLETVANSVDRRLKETEERLISVTDSVNFLLGRVEFVRRELMFELRYGALAPASQADQATIKSEVINHEKLTAARAEQLRLNLGCGHIPIEGYINIDRRALPGVDIVSEVDALPFKHSEVDEIFSAHLLEHFPQEQLRRALFPYYFSLLKPGGYFRAVVPDAEAMIQEYSNGNYPYDDLREVIYGAQDYEGDFHFNMFTPDSIRKLLIESGYIDIKILAAARKNGKCYELEISASKPKKDEI